MFIYNSFLKYLNYLIFIFFIELKFFLLNNKNKINLYLFNLVHLA